LHVQKYASEAETSLKLFQFVSVFCFSFISECATVLSIAVERMWIAELMYLTASVSTLLYTEQCVLPRRGFST